MSSENPATIEQLRNMTNQELWGLFDDQTREIMRAVIPEYSHNLHLSPDEFASFIDILSKTNRIDAFVQDIARILFDRRQKEKKLENIVDISMFGGGAVIVLTVLANIPDSVKTDILYLDIGGLTALTVAALVALRRMK